MSFPCGFALQLSDEFEDVATGGVRLLLVDLGGDDARILDAPVVDDTAILADCAIVHIGRIGGRQKRSLLQLARLVHVVDALDRCLNLGGQGEVVNRGGEYKDFRLRQQRVELLHVILLDACSIPLAVAIFAGHTAGDLLVRHVNERHLVPGGLCRLAVFFRHPGGVSVRTRRTLEDKDVHQFCPFCSVALVMENARY